MTQYKYSIPENLHGSRLDKALSSLCLESSRSQIQKAIKNDKLILNGQIISNLSSKVKENDEVEIIIIEEIYGIRSIKQRLHGWCPSTY